METYIHIWWVWLCAALVLAANELMIPASVFLGFALGALAMTVVVGFGLITNGPALFATFAALSLLAWVALKHLFKNQSSGAHTVTRDINEG